MFKKLLLLTCIIISSTAFAQEGLEKSPKKMTLEVGYSQIVRKTLNFSNSGFAFAFDYGWQVSGFKKKPKAYISIPLGYMSIPPMKEGTKNGGVSYYGVHITHELKRDVPVVPFFGYSLLFNQLMVQDTPGRVIGHETRFDAGANFGKRFFGKVEYSIATYPALGQKESNRLGSFGVKMGVRIR